MLKAAATGLAGAGVTVASTFASSLGLSLHQQRIAFAFGVLLIVVAGGLLVHDRRMRRLSPPDTHAQPVSVPQLLHRGHQLESNVMAQALTSGPSVDEQVLPWARAAWEALCDDHPQKAREFFGDGAPYRGEYFATAYSIARKNDPLGYIRSRIRILEGACGWETPSVRHHVDRPLATLPEPVEASSSAAELKPDLEKHARRGRLLLREMNAIGVLRLDEQLRECNGWIDQVESLLNDQPKLLRAFRKTDGSHAGSHVKVGDQLGTALAWFDQYVSNLEEIVSGLKAFGAIVSETRTTPRRQEAA